MTRPHITLVGPPDGSANDIDVDRAVHEFRILRGPVSIYFRQELHTVPAEQDIARLASDPEWNMEVSPVFPLTRRPTQA